MVGASSGPGPLLELGRRHDDLGYRLPLPTTATCAWTHSFAARAGCRPTGSGVSALSRPGRANACCYTPLQRPAQTFPRLRPVRSWVPSGQRTVTESLTTLTCPLRRSWCRRTLARGSRCGGGTRSASRASQRLQPAVAQAPCGVGEPRVCPRFFLRCFGPEQRRRRATKQ